MNSLVMPALTVSAVASTAFGIMFGFYPSVREWVTGEHYMTHAEKAGWAVAAGTLALGVGAFAETPGVREMKRLRSGDDVTDQMLIQAQWDTRNQYTPDVKQLGASSNDTSEFSFPVILWGDFVRDVLHKPQLYPHIGVFSPTGWGKTATIELFGDIRAEWYRNSAFCSPRTIYLSPTVQDDEFLGWECIGTGFKAQDISSFAIELRNQLYMSYQSTEKTPPLIVCPDEYRWLNKHTSEVCSVVAEVLDMGRKEDNNIFLSSTSYLVRTLGLEGEGQVRDNFLMVLKGELALQRVQTLETEGKLPDGSSSWYRKALDQFGVRACLVQDKFMLLPNITSYRAAKKSAGYTHINSNAQDIAAPSIDDYVPVPTSSKFNHLKQKR